MNLTKKTNLSSSLNTEKYFNERNQLITNLIQKQNDSFSSNVQSSNNGTKNEL
jgi:hypothetical protein